MDNFLVNPQTLWLWLIVLALTLFYWTGRKSRSSKTPPSTPGKLPIIGHLHLLTDMPHHTFAELADQYGPIIHLQLGQIPTVVVSSAELAKLVLKTHDHIFASRPQLISAQYLSFGCTDVTFSVYGPYWRQARKICVNELLSTRRVNSFYGIRDREINRMLAVLSARSGSVTDVSELFFTLSNDILCLVAFGKRFKKGSGEGQKSDLVSVLTEAQALFSGFCVGDFFPRWGWVNLLTGYKRRLTKNLNDLIEVYNEILQEHLEKKEKGTSLDNEDFVDVLLRVQQRDELDVPITDDNLKALVLDMFVAGTDTSSTTLEWVMTELAKNPRVLKKVQEEIRKIASGSKTIEEATHIPQFTYMRAVIKETMRLHTPLPLLVPRESLEKCNLNGYEIPAKTRIFVNSHAIHRDPKVWEKPLEFIPERFIENNMDFKDPDFRFLPFGGGRRGCPGYGFGLGTVELALSRLLYHFDWSLPAGVVGDDVDTLEAFGLTTKKRNPIFLVPKINKLYEFRANDP